MTTPTANSKKIHLLTNFFTVSSWTLLSRVLGFLRDILIAAFFGSGPLAEAFQVAFAFPNMFRRFFAEGAFNMAFVPMFSKKLENIKNAQKFAQDAMAGLASILIALTLIAQLFMPWFVLAMASGFQGDERFDITTNFARICFPYIIFISLAALFSGVLNSMGRFAAAAAAPIVLNIILIAAMAGTWALGGNIVKALVWGVPIAGIAQLALVWLAASRAGIRLLPQLPCLTPDIRRLALIAAPAALAGGVVQINLLVGRQVASYYDGAIQWLSMADRLYQLPLGVVGIAIGVVLLPDLSRKLKVGDTDGGSDAFNRATEFAIALTLPATVGLLVVPQAVVSVLFERGAFTSADSQNTAAAVAIYAVVLPAFVLQKVFQPLYFARENTKTPFYFALVSMVLNAAFAIGLSAQYGYLAAAIGTTLSSVALAILLYWGVRRMGNATAFDARLLRAIPRMFGAAIIMGTVTYGLSIILETWIATAGLRYIALAILIIGGTATYFTACLALGAFTKQDLLNFEKR